MNQLKQSIISTLCYSDIFNFPLTKNELYQHLLSQTLVSKKRFDTILAELHQNGNIRKTGSYFHLPDRASIINTRIQHQAASRIKHQRAQQIASRIIRLPYVEAVFLTGAVAVNNAPTNDDIDIMIVTTKKSLWTCRLFVNGWLDVHWLRRHPYSNYVTDKICANLFLSEDNMKMTRNRQNSYTAHEIVQSIPLADPRHLHAAFINENSWIYHFLPHAIKPTETVFPQHRLTAPSWMETMMRNLQLMYMKSKRTREMIADDAAFFHPRNTASIVQVQYKHRLKAFGL